MAAPKKPSPALQDFRRSIELLESHIESLTAERRRVSALPRDRDEIKQALLATLDKSVANGLGRVAERINNAALRKTAPGVDLLWCQGEVDSDVCSVILQNQVRALIEAHIAELPDHGIREADRERQIAQLQASIEAAQRELTEARKLAADLGAAAPSAPSRMVGNIPDVTVDQARLAAESAARTPLRSAPPRDLAGRADANF